MVNYLNKMYRLRCSPVHIAGIINQFDATSHVCSNLSRRICFRLTSLRTCTATVSGSQFSSKPEPKVKYSIKEKLKQFGRSDNFKYWVIGTTVIGGIITYYGLQTYQKSRINVELKPPTPNHYIVDRLETIKQLENLHRKSPKIGGKLKIMYLTGPPGYGKSLLAYNFAKYHLDKRHWTKYSFPKSNVNGFLNAENNEAFLISLKALAFSAGVKQVDLDLPDEKKLSTLGFTEQCNILLEALQAALNKHSGWFLTLDNMKSNSSKDLLAIIESWFFSKEGAAKWSKGTLLVTYDGNIGKNSTHVTELNLSKGLSNDEAGKLVCEISLIDDKVEHSKIFEQLNKRLYGNPLALNCAAVWLKDYLEKQQISSVEQAINKFNEELVKNLEQVVKDSPHLRQLSQSDTGKKLFVVETSIAMAAKIYSDNNPYLLHSFDFLGYVHPFFQIPYSAVSRYLKHPLYGLPKIEVTSSLDLVTAFNQSQSQMKSVKDNPLEPDGKAWSTKSLVNKFENMQNSVSDLWVTVKELYSYYFGKPEYEEKGSDGLDFLRNCSLISTYSIQPGDTEGICLHPLVYAVLRQQFLQITTDKIESLYMISSHDAFQHQSWIRKLKKFDEKSTLIAFRKSINDSLSEKAKQTVTDVKALNSCNTIGVNIGSVFQSKVKNNDADLECSTDDKFHHTLAHIQRVIQTVCDELTYTKNDPKGRAISTILSLNLQGMLNELHPNVVTEEARVNGLKAIAACATDVHGDQATAQYLLEDLLELQNKTKNTASLEYANILTRLAAVESSNDNTGRCISHLEKATEIYELDRKKYGEYKEPIEYARTLLLHGVVSGTIGEKRKSKELIERALMLQQAAPPDLSDESRSKQYGAEFACALTDLGHAYLSLGMAVYGRKILDLSLAANRNLHGEYHPEVVRTLTTLSIAHLMLGHNEQSKKLSKEAGKTQAAVSKAMPLI